VKRYALPLLLSAFLFIPTIAKAEMAPEQKKEIETLVHQYVLNNGGLLIESVNKFQAAEEIKANKDSEVKAVEFMKTIKDDKNLNIVGNPDGDVTVVEFFDYNCGYCKKALEEIQSLLKDDKNVVADLFGASRTPEVFVIGKDNTILYHGRITDNKVASEQKSQDLKIAVEEISSGKNVSVKETKSFGCGIKRIEK